MFKLDKVTIEISREVFEKLKKVVEESGGEFKSVNELAEFILREAVSEEEESVYTPEEEEEIKRRLRSLGYL